MTSALIRTAYTRDEPMRLALRPGCPVVLGDELITALINRRIDRDAATLTLTLTSRDGWTRHATADFEFGAEGPLGEALLARHLASYLDVAGHVHLVEISLSPTATR